MQTPSEIYKVLNKNEAIDRCYEKYIVCYPFIDSMYTNILQIEIMHITPEKFDSCLKSLEIAYYAAQIDESKIIMYILMVMVTVSDNMIPLYFECQNLHSSCIMEIMYNAYRKHSKHVFEYMFERFPTMKCVKDYTLSVELIRKLPSNVESKWVFRYIFYSY